MNSTTRRLGVFAAAIASVAVAGYGSAAAGNQHPGGTDAHRRRRLQPTAPSRWARTWR